MTKRIPTPETPGNFGEIRRSGFSLATPILLGPAL
jgi:hypothetical protein